MASHLTPALSRAGYDAEMVGSRDIRILPAADLYVVAVRDDALESVIGRMRQLTTSPIVHTAGSKPASLADGVLYPMQTFSKARPVDFSTVHFFIEAASPALLALLREVSERIVASSERLPLQRDESEAVANRVHESNVEAVSGHVHELDSEGRKRLHLAAVFACNFANHCCTLAEEVLRPLGLPFEVMLPLLDETVAKLHHLSPHEAQTGPAIRHDESVMATHRDLLASQPQLQALYDLLSTSIQNIGSQL